MRSRETHKPVLIALILILSFTLTLVICCLLFPNSSTDNHTDIDVSAFLPEIAIPDTNEQNKLNRIDFQPIINEWVNKTGGRRSVLIYDLDREEIVGAYNENDEYNTASLYKLFVVYEGYRRVQEGSWNGDEPAGSTGYSVSECLKLAISRSHSECAETLWKRIGKKSLDKIIVEDYGITDSDISSLVSNPSDIMQIMKLFYEHPEIKDEKLVDSMKDSFLNQPVTEYDWRQGLPSGFSVAKVYNKVGWNYIPDERYWDIYHDAAIVEFPENVSDNGEASPARHFIVVVMTSRVPFQKIRDLGRTIESAVLENNK